MTSDTKVPYKQVTCPICGKAVPVRIQSLKGKLRLSIYCKKCKSISEVEVENV